MNSAPYFQNHARRHRFPWSLYHRDLEQRLAQAVTRLPQGRPKVLIVGCGLEPFIPGVQGPLYYGADIDETAIRACRAAYPHLQKRLATCPDAYRLPQEGAFDVRFDAIVAKEVIEHVGDPVRWLTSLASRLAPGGELLITTPNYGRFSTLPLLEVTVLELFARRDGYSRRHIHPSRFNHDRLKSLSIPDMQLLQAESTFAWWALFARWRKLDG